MLLTTVESHFLEPPREMKIGSTNRWVRKIGSKTTERYTQRKLKLVREIGRFEKSRVREIGIPLRKDQDGTLLACIADVKPTLNLRLSFGVRRRPLL